MASNSNNGKNDIFQNMADRLFGGNRGLALGVFWVGLFTFPWLVALGVLCFGLRPASPKNTWNGPIHYNAPKPPPRPQSNGVQQATVRQAPPPRQTQPPQPRQTPAQTAAKQPRPPKPRLTGDAQADRLLEASHQFLCDAEPLLREMDNTQVREKAESICRKVQSIMDWVQKNPASAGNAGRLASYYLPTTLKLFQSYTLVDDRPGPNAQAICAQVDRALTTLEQALTNLQDDLLGNTALDVEAEINAMEMMLGREGLTDDFRISAFEEGAKNQQEP